MAAIVLHERALVQETPSDALDSKLRCKREAAWPRR
jgi:hypothetical protein